MKFRFFARAYVLIAIVLLTISFVTTRRAKQISGEDHYLFTQTRIFYSKYVPPKNATDAALDEAQKDDDDAEQAAESDKQDEAADRAGVMTVDEPLFVLGFLDVTGSFIILGGMALLTTAAIRKSRRKTGHLTAPEPTRAAQEP